METLPAAQFSLVYRRSPFQVRPKAAAVGVGASLADCIAIAGVPDGFLPFAHVYLGQRRFPQQAWRLVRPKAGVQVTIVVVPQGGNTLRTLAFLAVAIAAIAIAPYAAPFLGIPAGTTGAAVAGGLAGLGVTIVGGLLVNALIPVAVQEQDQLQASSKSTYFIEGARNQGDPDGAVPVVLGRHRVFPRLGSGTFTEIVGDDQYLRILLVWGYGPMTLASLKIGEQNIAAFDGVEIEHRYGEDDDEPLTLFPGVVFEDLAAADLEVGAARTIRTTEPDTDEVSVDIFFPQGLYSVGRKTGDKSSCGVLIVIERRLKNTSEWTELFNGEIRAEQTEPMRRGYRYVMPARGQYEIAVRCTAQQSGGGQEVQQRQLSAVRSIRNTEPIGMAGLCKTAIRIKASGQLYDEISEINGDASLLVPNWNGTDWDTVEATSNPASLLRWVLTGPANARPWATSRLDNDSFTAFHAECEAQGWTFNYVYDRTTNLTDVIKAICAAGWATIDFVDGTWRVVMDRQQDTVRQWFTPRTIKRGSFQGAIAYPELPHAFRVRLINSSLRYARDEMVVYQRGYTEATASLFETLEVPGIVNRVLARKFARRQLAQAVLRRESLQIDTDFASLVVGRGDLVGIAHDVLLVGTGTARVLEARVSSGFVPIVELDAEVTIQGPGYVVRFQHLDGTTSTHEIVESFGDTASLQLVEAIAEADAPAEGCQAMVGPGGRETTRWLVRQIEPDPELGARLTLTPEAPELYDDNPDPSDEDVGITPPAGELVPAFTSIESGGAVLLRSTSGAYLPRIVVRLRHDSSRPLWRVTGIEVQYRKAGLEDWIAAGFTNENGAISINNVQTGKVYEIRARYRFKLGGTGLWAGPVEHTVVGVTDPPPDVPWATLDGNDRITWRYDSPPVDHRGFRVRWGALSLTNWNDAKPLHDAIVTSNYFPLSRVPEGARSVLIKAQDAAGNLSLNPARVQIVADEEEPWRVIDTRFYASEGWPGSLSNGYGVASLTLGEPLELHPLSIGVFISATSKAFVAEDAEAFISGGVATMRYKTNYVVPASARRGDRIRVFVISDDERAYELLYRVGAWGEGQIPFANGLKFSTGFGWSVGVGNYYAPMPRVIEAPDAGERVWLYLRSTSRIYGVVVKTYARQRSEIINDLFVPAGGVKVPYTSAFRSVRTVNATIVGEVNPIRTYRITDRTNLAVGPRIIAYDSGGNPVAGIVDVTIEGD